MRIFPDSVLEEIKSRLNPVSWNMLEILSEKQSLSLVNLMNLSKLNQAKFYSELSRLDGAVLIDQSRDEVDGRQKKVSINANGLAILKLRSNANSI